MNDQPKPQSQSQTEQSMPAESNSSAAGTSGTSRVDWKKIAIFTAAGLVLFLLKDLVFGLLQFAIFLIVLAGIGIVGYSALQLSKQKDYERLAQVVQEQRSFLEATQHQYSRDPATVLKVLQDYFLEKTWGISGLRWRINNFDPEQGKIVADFECCESASGELLPASTSYATSPPKSFGLFPAVLPSKQTANRRYATVKINVLPDTGGGTILEYDWDFRYTEQTDRNRPPAVPPALFAICKDIPQTLKNQEL